MFDLGKRRAILEAIIDDPDASHGDRLRADERLAELEMFEARGIPVDDLSPEEAVREAESIMAGMPGILACARVAAGWDPSDAVDPPSEIVELEEVVQLQQTLIAELECRLLDREAALQNITAQRLLPAAPGGML